MTEFKCPNCELVIEANTRADGKLVCPKCLDAFGKRFIMIESSHSSKNKNLGGGFFERDESL